MLNTSSKLVFHVPGTLDQSDKHEQVLEIMDELKEKHGNVLSPYKFRLWAEMIVRNNFHRPQFLIMHYFFIVHYCNFCDLN